MRWNPDRRQLACACFIIGNAGPERTRAGGYSCPPPRLVTDQLHLTKLPALVFFLYLRNIFLIGLEGATSATRGLPEGPTGRLDACCHYSLR
jgi:hypothetical protein